MRAHTRLTTAVFCALGGFAVLGAAPAGAMGEHGSGDCSPGLAAATARPIVAHFQSAHLQRSPEGQAADLAATDDYTLVHTVWVQNWTAPARYGALDIASGTPKPIVAHFQKAHFERSPTQQVADLAATDDYVLLHTVWAESIAQPTVDVLTGSPC